MQGFDVGEPGRETDTGKAIVRFPSQGSGYLNISQAKVAILNQFYKQKLNGKFILRFDDTNPSKPNSEFEKVILEDLELFGIKPDLITHTSQYFDLTLQYCETLLNVNKAYADDTEPKEIKKQREQRIESANRSNSVEKNLEMWTEMLNGSVNGERFCIRAKIDMSSTNGCLRDPTIYVCKNEVHPKTETKYKVYPTYDFVFPIIDAIEKVTHTLRSMEYHDRNDQFFWFLDALNLKRPHIIEYSSLNMPNTLLSNKTLTWFVQEGFVDGWDDPRFPTVRGILRRGMTVQGLTDFVTAQESSKSEAFMEWDKLWSVNKKVIDPIAARYTAIGTNNVIVIVSGATEQYSFVPAHPNNSELGMKTVWFGPRILIDYVDAKLLNEGEMATFINWGNLMITKVNKEYGRIVSIEASLKLDNFLTKTSVAWLCETLECTPTYCVYFDHLISKAVLGKDEDFKTYIGRHTRIEVEMIGDPELRKCKKGDIIQLQRRGFFKVDRAYATPNSMGVTYPVILLEVPDGKEKLSVQPTTSKEASSAKKSLDDELDDVKRRLSQAEAKLRVSEQDRQAAIVSRLNEQVLNDRERVFNATELAFARQEIVNLKDLRDCIKERNRRFGGRVGGRTSSGSENEQKVPA